MTEPIDLTDYSFYTVAKVEDLPPGERLFVEIGDVSIVVFNIAGKLFAIGDICTHDDGPLGDGELDGHQIICPRHGARFDVRNGKVLSLPAVVDIPTYPVRITEDDIEVGVPD
ncbi:MAG: non-heme iron oxygenase ferredoxin subunit [Chloroflexota bacterium]|jgi:3-phenylpropionate/trans-cinnamate dioxygenase ferredoxin subunit|uniref:Rieske (2Fe-2S) protein n=1 Tax=Bellilinea sp. TaxID=2838785 RepID=UPI002ADE75DB|nr:non-heme iron oxygenase ferredoxin subunit [Bellilinea sp.]